VRTIDAGGDASAADDDDVHRACKNKKAVLSQR